MEKDDTKNSYGKAPAELSPGTLEAEAAKEAGKSRGSHNKSKKQKKKSLWQHWKSASRTKQIKWVAKGIAVVTGVLVLGVYIWGNLQNKWQFNAEHRPKVVFSRPPELLGAINYEVTDKAIYLRTGPMHVWVKNIRKGDAASAFIVGPIFKLVTEKKIGDPLFDDLPSVTDEMCKRKTGPKMKLFPVHGGEEVRENIAQVSETVGFNTNSVTVFFEGSKKEAEISPGEKPDRIPIAKDTIFQLYAPICVYYFDENGQQHGSCRTYRIAIDGHVGTSRYSFSAVESPVGGIFEEALFGYCEN